MLIKGFLAAGLMAAAVAVMPGTASAKTHVNVDIGIGLGGGYNSCYYHPYAPGCGYGYGYRPYVNRVYVAPRVIYNNGISCGQAKAIVWRSGFNRVNTRSCGAIDTFTGWRNGKRFLINVNRNGNINYRRW